MTSKSWIFQKMIFKMNLIRNKFVKQFMRDLKIEFRIDIIKTAAKKQEIWINKLAYKTAVIVLILREVEMCHNNKFSLKIISTLDYLSYHNNKIQ
jgi:hypothetical protein